MLKIWGRLNSINVQKVVWCADELGLKYERIDAGREHGINKTPEYLAHNPNGLIPMIEDNGFILWESNAIVRYLAAKYGSAALCPVEPRLRASADRWMDWQATTFNPAIAPAFTHLIRTAEKDRDAKLIEASRVAGESKLVVLDAHLAKNQFMIGDVFTMGDIPLGLSVHRWYALPLAREAHPHVERWYQTLRARKGVAQVMVLPIT